MCVPGRDSACSDSRACIWGELPLYKPPHTCGRCLVSSLRNVPQSPTLTCVKVLREYEGIACLDANCTSLVGEKTPPCAPPGDAADVSPTHEEHNASRVQSEHKEVRTKHLQEMIERERDAFQGVEGMHQGCVEGHAYPCGGTWR